MSKPALPASHGRIYSSVVLLATCLVAGACVPNDAADRDRSEERPENAATRIAERGDTAWDYVALGDSQPAGAGIGQSYVDYYAVHISDDLGIDVRVRNWAKDGQTTAILLNEIRTNPRLRTDLREAEIITLWIGWNDMGLPLALYRLDQCGGANKLDCIHEAVAALNANMDAIMDEILTLRTPEDALIRIADAFNPFVDEWKEQGTFQLLRTAAFEDWRAHILQAAAERKFAVVHTHAALNGPSGEQGLTGRGLMQADGLHFNEDGHRLLAQLHREAGYDFSAP